MRHWKQLLHAVLNEARWEFARSSGPGGQNVNKVESKSVLRWSLSKSYLGLEEKNHLREHLSRYLTKEEELVSGSDRFRDREMNKKDVINKVKLLFEKAFYKPPTRKKTKPTKGSRLRRLESKTKHKELKTSRKKIDY